MQILNKYAAIQSPFMPDVENKIIADSKDHHYQLVRMGWYQDKHVHYAVFYFEIADGKVLIQENRTDVDIAKELVVAGIDEKDIASGLKHPKLKKIAA